jgi:hypothetical protein
MRACSLMEAAVLGCRWPQVPPLAALAFLGNLSASPNLSHLQPIWYPTTRLSAQSFCFKDSPDHTDGDTELDVPSWDNVHLGTSNGDFARYVPHSSAARKLFSQAVRLLESDASKWHHVRKFIHYEIAYPDESTAGISFANDTPTPQHEPVQDYCGYY